MKERKKPPLWFYGLLCILGGCVGWFVVAPSEPGPLTEFQRGQVEGRETAVVLFVLAGVVLVVISVVKRFRSGGDKGRTR